MKHPSTWHRGQREYINKSMRTTTVLHAEKNRLNVSKNIHLLAHIRSHPLRTRFFRQDTVNSYLTSLQRRHALTPVINTSQTKRAFSAILSFCHHPPYSNTTCSLHPSIHPSTERRMTSEYGSVNSNDSNPMRINIRHASTRAIVATNAHTTNASGRTRCVPFET